jgi:hypothetical protein
MLYAYSNLLYAHSKYSGSNISMINIMEAPSLALCAFNVLVVAQCSFKIWCELL